MTIDGTKETETELCDLHAMAEILRRVGLTEVRFQENYRIPLGMSSGCS